MDAGGRTPSVRAWRDIAERCLRVAPAAIVTAACALAIGAGWDNSATNDEPYHTLAAFAYAHDGHGDLNVEHPPLVKMVAGAALLPLHLRGTETSPVARLLVLSAEVRRFLYLNTAPADTILRVARLAQLVFLPLLLTGVYAWSRWALGRKVALLALVATASQPLVLGHAFVLHTDVPAAAAWTWSLFLLHRWLAGRRQGWLPFGAALGLALLVKFSAAYLLPLAAIAVLVAILRSHRYAELARLGGACVVALVILLAGMAIPLRNGDLAEERATIATTLGLWPGTGETVRHLQAVAAVNRPLAHYLLGLAYVYETSLHGQGVNFFFGRTDVGGFALYFPAALVLKTSLPFLALVCFGLLGAIRSRQRADAILLTPALYYLAISLNTSYNIGARHLLPVIPLLAVFAARHAARLARWPRLALVICLVASPILAFPHYIAHFSLLVGGARHGERYLNDSNLDWGQDWARLAREAARRGWRPMAYVYLGAGDPRSAMPEAADALEKTFEPRGAFLAISSYADAVGVQYLRALRYRDEAARLEWLLELARGRGTVVGQVGHTIRIYRLPGEWPRGPAT